jgi:hypothetical protein
LNACLHLHRDPEQSGCLSSPQNFEPCPETELDPRQRQKDYVAKTWASGIMKMKFNFN